MLTKMGSDPRGVDMGGSECAATAKTQSHWLRGRVPSANRCLEALRWVPAGLETGSRTTGVWVGVSTRESCDPCDVYNPSSDLAAVSPRRWRGNDGERLAPLLPTSRKSSHGIGLTCNSPSRILLSTSSRLPACKNGARKVGAGKHCAGCSRRSIEQAKVCCQSFHTRCA